MLFTHPRWSIPFSTAWIVLFQPGFCLTICLHVQCISLQNLSSYPAISSLLDHFISLSLLSLSLSLSLSTSSPLVLLFLSLDLKAFCLHFSLSQRKGFTLLLERNYFWRILSCGMWRPVVMRVVPQGTIRITKEHHIPEDLNLQDYHFENLKYRKNFFYCNTEHSRCCDMIWCDAKHTSLWFWMKVWKIWEEQSKTNMNWWHYRQWKEMKLEVTEEFCLMRNIVFYKSPLDLRDMKSQRQPRLGLSNGPRTNNN